MGKLDFTPVVTVFYCTNALGGAVDETEACRGTEIRQVHLPCSSLVKDVYLLRAFEAGADAVVVIACLEGNCQFIDGNLRAVKRVERTRKMLAETGVDGGRIFFFNTGPGKDSIGSILEKVMDGLGQLGPSPVR